MKNHRICPVSKAKKLTSIWRFIFQNPYLILGKYLNPGDIALDLGCGPGFFTIPLSRLVGQQGKVYAYDVQQPMLDILQKRISDKYPNIDKRLIKEDSLEIPESIDFALGYYIIHELSNPDQYLDEIESKLKSGGVLYIAEPVHHVSYEEADRLKDQLLKRSFKLLKFKSSKFEHKIVLQKIS